jgi:hypothetical protein
MCHFDGGAGTASSSSPCSVLRRPPPRPSPSNFGQYDGGSLYDQAGRSSAARRLQFLAGAGCMWGVLWCTWGGAVGGGGRGRRCWAVVQSAQINVELGTESEQNNFVDESD